MPGSTPSRRDRPRLSAMPMSTLAPALRARFGGLGAPYWSVWLGLFLNRSGQFVPPLLTWWLTGSHGLSFSQAGAVVALYSLGGAIGVTTGGVVADRVGRRATLLVSAASAAVVLAALSFSAALPVVILGAFALALAQDLHRPAVMAMVADLVPVADRVRAYALLYVAVNLGFSFAPALGGWLSGQGFATVFAGAALVQLAWGIFAWRRLPETRPKAAAELPGSLREVLSDRVYLLFLAVLAGQAILPHQAFVALAGWMKAEGFDAATYGAVIAFNGVLIVLVQPWVAPRVAREDPVRVFCVASLLQGLGFAMHGLGLGVPGHLGAIAVWTMGEILAAPVTSSVIAALAPEHLRARYQGMGAVAFATAGMAGPLLGGWLLDHVGGGIWPACLALGISGALGMAALGPRLRARLAA